MTPTARLRWLLRYTASGPSPTSVDRQVESAEEWGVLKTTAVQWTGWQDEHHKTLPLELWGLRHLEVKPGDLVVTKAGPRQRVGVSSFVDAVRPQLIVSGKMILMRVDETQVDPRYLNWQLSTPTPQAYLNACKTGMAEAQMNFTNEDLMAMTVSVPPILEQRRISAFISQETARLDLIRRAREIQLVRILERHKSLLVGLVSGRGLDGRRSHLVRPGNGIVTSLAPPSWRVVPLRRILLRHDRPTRTTDSVITAYRDGQVTLRSRRREEGYTFSDIEAGYQGVEPGDLVFHALDGFAGAVGVSDSRGKASPVYHVCGTSSDDDARFMGFALQAMGLLGYLEVQAGNVRQRSVDFRTWEVFARLPLPRPPAQEQRRIADLVVESRIWTERAVVALREQLLLLAERRQALIAAAVTGQIDVSTARGVEV